MVLEQAQVQNLAQVTSLGDKHVHPCSLIKIYAKTAYTDQTALVQTDHNLWDACCI